MRLRGAPLLLSPADWQVAPPLAPRRGAARPGAARAGGGLRPPQGARRQGEDHSLRYCAPAVEAAWAEVRELTAPGRAAGAPSRSTCRRASPRWRRALPAGARRAATSSAARIARAGRAIRGGRGAARRARPRDAAPPPPASTSRGARRWRRRSRRPSPPSRGRLPADELERSRERLARQVLRRRLAPAGAVAVLAGGRAG